MDISEDACGLQESASDGEMSKDCSLHSSQPSMSPGHLEPISCFLDEDSDKQSNMLPDAEDACCVCSDGSSIQTEPLLPHRPLSSFSFSLAPLPSSGSFDGERVEGITLDMESVAPLLAIHLQQEAHAQSLAPCSRRRFSGLVAAGAEPVLQRYGTIRRIPFTHFAGRVLTLRNQYDLPSALYFDPAFREACAARGLQREQLRCVSPAFAEWLMGLPSGWTELAPRPGGCIHPLRDWRTWAQRHDVLSVFSGVAGLDLGLSCWCDPVAYVEICVDATSVLQARMGDGSLQRRPIFNDVRSVRAQDLGRRVVGVVGGVPCFGSSVAGGREGLGHPETALLYELLRLVLETEAVFFFHREC